jgi:hypothetical protein
MLIKIDFKECGFGFGIQLSRFVLQVRTAKVILAWANGLVKRITLFFIVL